MKCFSWNVNGIRAVEKKGALQNFIQKYDPDILMIQEIKAHTNKLSENLSHPKGYNAFYHSAEKAGYSGVAIWVKDKYKTTVERGMPLWNDTEARVIRVDIKQYSFIGVYVPNGGKSGDAYIEKLKFLQILKKYISELNKDGRICVISGDMNVARTSIDLHNPQSNKNHVCFRKELRECFENVLSIGLVDVYRKYFPDKLGAYTWWANFDFSLSKGVKPRDINKGWRIDYFLVFDKDIKNIKNVEIHSEVMGSDHCPISINIM